MDNNSTKEKWSAASEKLMAEVGKMILSNATDFPNELTDVGQIDHIDLPAGWEEGPRYEQREHSPSYQEFHPPGEKDCQLGFYYRGRRVSDRAAQTFRKILSLAEHVLSHGEFDALSEIVGDKINPADFHVTTARTKSINGKMVLIIDGRYLELQHETSHIFLDADGTGSAVQQIFFQAPVEKFPLYQGVAHRALLSIRWK